MQKSINRQSGFAIGTILLAVVLIAAIVSAIAIASRGTSSQGNREQARVNASTIVQQGVALKSGFDRMISTGTTPATITLGVNATVAGSDTLGVPGSGGTPTEDPRGNCISADPCMYTAGTGGASIQNPPGQSLINTAALTRYNLRRASTVPGVGPNVGSDIIVLLGAVREDVCRQLQNMGSGGSISVGTAIPVLTAAIALNATEATGADLTGATSGQQEGCFQNAAGGLYYYYKVMVEG